MQIDPAFRHPGVLLTGAALVGVAGFSMFSLARERQHVKALDVDRAQAVAELDRTRSQIRDISARLDSLAAAKTTRRTVPVRSQSVRSRPADTRLQQVRSEV